MALADFCCKCTLSAFPVGRCLQQNSDGAIGIKKHVKVILVPTLMRYSFHAVTVSKMSGIDELLFYVGP